MDDKDSQTSDLSQVEFVTFEEYQEPGKSDPEGQPAFCQED